MQFITILIYGDDNDWFILIAILLIELNARVNDAVKRKTTLLY